jgi:hypothetical protein
MTQLSFRVSRGFRVSLALALEIGACGAAPAYAQAPPTGPLVLHLPTSARTAALANAWVAGRDLDVIFRNPAQMIGTRSTLDLSLTRLGPASKMFSSGSIYAAGPRSLTFGWGVQAVGFRAPPAASYPYDPDLTLEPGSRNGTSLLVTLGGAFVFKGFRVGAAAKYVSDIVASSPAVLNPSRVNQHRILGDVGVARNLFGGAAAIAFQNLGAHTRKEGVYLPVPRQIAAGWSSTRVAGPIDLGVFSQVTVRKGWTSPALGVEAGYGWIEGLNVTLRAGVRRPETDREKPLSLGAAFTFDRLVTEYAVRFFDGGGAAHGVTLRWR